MKTSVTLILIVCSAFILTVSCKKKDGITPANTSTSSGKLVLKTNATMAGKDLTLNKYYALNSNDSIKIETFKFYISNVKLKNKTTGVWFSVPESYFLFDQSNASSQLNAFALNNIPVGEYSEISFYTGVDSLTNSTEVIANKIAALSPANDMIWEWNTGYIFYKLEGFYKNVNQTTNKGILSYQLGSNATLSKQTLVLPASIQIQDDAINVVALHADVAKLFTGANTIDVNTTNNVIQTGDMGKLTQNYSNMYTITAQ